MAHEIENENAFFTSTPAWHRIGQTLTDAPSIEKACEIAYPHSIVKLPVCGKIDAENYISDPDRSLIVRDDGKILGCMGNDYTFPQPREAFEFFAPFVDQGLVDLESGGSLRDGKRMWALAKVKNGIGEVLPGDEIKAYYLVYTAFDGSLSHGIMPTNTRVVCANTLRAAIEIDSKGKNSFKLKHTKNLMVRIDKAQEQIAMSLNQFKKDLECYQSLAKKTCTDIQLETYVRDVFEAHPNEKEEVSTRMENKVQHIIDMTLIQPEREKIPVMAGTFWNAYNGVTRYLSHEYGRSEENRTDALWFGQSATMNQKALELALQA